MSGKMSKEKFLNIVNGFRESRIILSAVELGIFNLISDKAMTSKNVAQLLKLEPRAVDRVMNALAAMKLLEKKDNLFRNTTFSREHLVEGSDNYLANLMHSVKLWDTWSGLTDVIRTGKPTGNRTVTDRDSDWYESFIAAMHSGSKMRAKSIADNIDFTGVKTILDVGGGSGGYSMEFLRRHPDMKAVVFDLPEVTPITQKYLQAEKMTDRISTLDGNYHASELGSGYQLILLSSIIHMNSPEENEKLFRKCHRALDKDGQIVIQDFVMEENRVEPFHGALFSINMLVGTAGGDTYTFEEIRGWLTSAGFGQIEFKDSGTGTYLVIGKKK